MTLGQSIQAARKARGLSQEALAAEIGVSRQALGKWEKDTSLPGVDNLQALAAALGVGVDTLLGTHDAPDGAPADDTSVPGVTLDALRDLLDARDAEAQRRRRTQTVLAAAAAGVLLLAFIIAAYYYKQQLDAVNFNYMQLQSSWAQTQANLNNRLDDLQSSVQKGESTVLDWSWQATAAPQADGDTYRFPAQVQVTPRTESAGMTAQLTAEYADGTRETRALTRSETGAYATAETLPLPYDSDTTLSVQWTTADGVSTSEILDTLYFDGSEREPEFRKCYQTDDSFGYRTHGYGAKKKLTLTSYPVEVDISRPAWMRVQSVTAALWIDGTAVQSIDLTSNEDYGVVGSTSEWAVWSGSFAGIVPKTGWPYTGGAVQMIVTVTDTFGGQWPYTIDLVKK